ncbi:MAG: DUF5683 domain-containing protein [Bacteroidales bacterium]|jgi:hypothetical protein
MNYKFIFSVLTYCLFCSFCFSQTEIQNKSHFTINSDNTLSLDTLFLDSLNVLNKTSKINADTLTNESIKDSTKKKRLTEPQKAGLLSAAFPSLGQIYNKKYWKIPIVWGGFAATSYFIITNAKPMQQVKKAYVWIDNGKVGAPPNNFAVQYPSTDKLQAIYNQYRSNVELFTLLTAVWYTLNIVDAIVDGHLKDFNISEDISLDLKPIEMPPMLNPTTHDFYTCNAIMLNLSIKLSK